MNERGISFVETLVAMSILCLLTLTLIPLTYQMQAKVQKHVASYYASEVAYNGALLVQRYSVMEGTQQVNNILYEWHYDGQAICTKYHFDEEVLKRCVS